VATSSVAIRPWQSLPQAGRVARKPVHTFHLRHYPFAIQPFMIAPVLPGETMKNLLMQSRVVLDPIKNPLIGWWLEYYWFYVKHSDMDARDNLQSLMLDPAFAVSAIQDTTADVNLYHAGAAGAVNWTQRRGGVEQFHDLNECSNVSDFWQ
jgi:hypothetical protein